MSISSEVTIDFQDQIYSYLSKLKDVIERTSVDQINTVIGKLIEVNQRQGFVYIFGNGGSASTASHFVNDFNKGASENLKQKFKFCCLSDNISTLLSIANDISYEQIFKFQLENYLTSNDLVIGISGSGNSRNVIKAIEFANSMNAETIGLTGFDGGELIKIVKYYIHIPVNDMQLVEDLHVVANHLIMKVIKEYLEEMNNVI